MATATLTAVIDTKGAKKAESELNSIAKKAKVVDIQTGKATKSFKAFGKSAAQAVAAVDGPLGGIASRITAVTSLASSGAVVFTALASAIAGVGFATVNGIKNLDEYNVSLKRVEATIKATGAGVGFTGQQLQQTAEELAIATLTSVDSVQKAQAQLLTFNRVLGAEFTKSIELSQDLAEAGFGTIESNAVLLGKALQDPIKGISALTRVGVTLSESQKQLAREAAEVGDVFKAQQIVLSAIASQVDGVGAAVASGTLAGELDTAGIAIERFTRAFAESSGALTVWQQIVKGVGVSANELAVLLEAPTSDDLFQKSLESSLALAEAQSKLSAILDENSTQYNRQEKIVSRLAQENREAIALAREAAEVENKKIFAQGEATRKEIEARKKIQESLKAEAEVVKQIETEKEQAKIDKLRESAVKQLEVFTNLNNTELEAINTKEQARLDKIKEFRAKELITEQEFQNAKTEIEESSAADRDVIDKEITDKKKSREDEKVKNQKETGEQALSNLKSILGEESATYKAAAIFQATIDTYKAANSAYSSLAPIPYVGPALGIAAAGVAVAAGVANVQKIQSAREQGGQAIAGQNILVGERGPEIISTSQNSKVLNNSKTNSMLNGESSPSVSLVVIDQSLGEKEYTEEAQDDGSIVLLIRNTVSGDVANANSQISKSISASTTAERKR